MRQAHRSHPGRPDPQRPEQAKSPHTVDSRADLFGLGASMFWALTGREPFPETGNPVQDLHRRFTTEPPAVRRVREAEPHRRAVLVDPVAAGDLRLLARILREGGGRQGRARRDRERTVHARGPLTRVE